MRALALSSLLFLPAFGPACLLLPASPEPEPPPRLASCQGDRDCLGPSVCDKENDGDDLAPIDDPAGVCVSIGCLEDADCDDGTVCDAQRFRCEPPIVCDAADPRVSCDDDDVCLVSEVGAACTVAPVAERCALVPASIVTASGVTARFDAIATDGAGRLVPGALSSLQEVRTCAGPDPCRTEVTMVAGGVECHGTWVVLPPRAVDTARVLVVDAEDGRPLPGVTVSAGDDEATTDDDGVAVLPAGLTTVTATPADDAYATLTLRSPGDEPVLPLRRVGVQAAGGRIDDLTPSPGVRVALAGLSFGDLDDLDVPALCGASGTVTLDIPDIIEPGTRLSFSSGAALGVGSVAVRENFVAFARPGPRLLWMFEAALPLAAIAPLLGPPDTVEPRDLRIELLRRTGPEAKSGIDARLTIDDSVEVFPAGLDNDLDAMAVAGASAYAGTIDVTADADVTVGALPTGTRDVIVAVGAVVRGRGLVLLGGKVASAVRDDEAGHSAEVPGTVRVPFAPPHSGLEGRDLVAVVVAVDAERLAATDRLGMVRAVVPLASPSPSSPLVTAQVPALDRPPSARVEGNSVVVTEPGSADRLRLTLRSGRTIWAPATAATIDVDDDDNDLTGAELSAVRLRADPFSAFVTPWESIASVQTIALP
jgi:hypothetical protein